MQKCPPETLNFKNKTVESLIYQGFCGRIIRRNKSAYRRVIVSALEIIEPRLAVVVVSAIAYRINYAYVV